MGEQEKLTQGMPTPEPEQEQEQVVSGGEDPDKLAKVREAGEIIRKTLASNVQARFGDEANEETLTELRTVLVGVANAYLRQIFPQVEVKAFITVEPPQTKVSVFATGQFSIKVTPDGEASPA
jgi:hypothetical protein